MGRCTARGPRGAPTARSCGTGAFDRGRQIGVWRTYDRNGKVLKETPFGE